MKYKPFSTSIYFIIAINFSIIIWPGYSHDNLYWVWLGKYQGWEMSRLGNIKIGKCPDWEISRLGNVQVRKCPG